MVACGTESLSSKFVDYESTYQCTCFLFLPAVKLMPAGIHNTANLWQTSRIAPCQGLGVQLLDWTLRMRARAVSLLECTRILTNSVRIMIITVVYLHDMSILYSTMSELVKEFIANAVLLHRECIILYHEWACPRVHCECCAPASCPTTLAEVSLFACQVAIHNANSSKPTSAVECTWEEWVWNRRNLLTNV